jgi:hypothetical protein
MLFGSRMHGLHQAIEAREDEVAGFPHLERLRRVDDV